MSELAGNWIARNARVWSGAEPTDLHLQIKDTGYVQGSNSKAVGTTWGNLGIESDEMTVDVTYFKSDLEAAPVAGPPACPVLGLLDPQGSTRARFSIAAQELTFEMVHDPLLVRPWSEEAVAVTYRRSE